MFNFDNIRGDVSPLLEHSGWVLGLITLALIFWIVRRVWKESKDQRLSDINNYVIKIHNNTEKILDYINRKNDEKK